ncbi:pyridoxamine 5'-phosphate oxidase family protein [Ferruginibacter sp.]
MKTGILITKEGNGKLKEHTIVPTHVDNDGNLWFFTNECSDKVNPIPVNGKVKISYGNPKDNDYVVIHGNAIIVKDKKKMLELWSAVGKVWFGNGLHENELALLKIVPLKIEYTKENGRH